MNVLITGGAGFIGSALCDHLSSLQYDVSVIDNFSFGSRDFLHIGKSNIYEGDVLDKDFVDKVMGEVRPQWVIHLAAIHFIPYCNEFPFLASNVNIVGTKNVLQAVASTKTVEKLLFASTAAVYPISNVAHRETDIVQPTDIYGLSKMVGEHLCSEFNCKTSIPTIICRFFNAFGPNETNPHLIPTIQAQIQSGSRTLRLGNLQPKRDFIHTSDMATAVSLLMQKFNGSMDTFNLGQGVEYSVMEIIKTFEEELNEPVRVEIDPEKVRKVERMNLLADISKLTHFTGWKPKVSINDGIKSLLNKSLIN